ncbi:PDZ and LIM domain protein 3 isoform X1 [Patella vulgata]|uniref:PDZ and LIM domain protein 3 isoform X1 n=1 Tax=Patella vulgata TaxID=6465 RepID=UPI00217F7DD6|nr:PDZ and LIM domain protein 3 isoform X1 [Patella vulgata]
MSNVEHIQGETLGVHLSRPDSGTPWGFRLQGGVDFSTPLSIQVVQPNSVAERSGLKPQDAILRINNSAADNFSHEDAKMEIVRSGNDIQLLIQRGAVKIWKPQVTNLSELRPAELKPVKTQGGQEFAPVQKTSLAVNKPDTGPCTIGSSHNRAAKPFGAPAVAIPNVTHSQYNTPIGLYSGSNIADTYVKQTHGIAEQVQGLSLDNLPVGGKVDSMYRPQAPPSQGEKESAQFKEWKEGETPQYKGYTNPHAQSRSFHALQENLDDQELAESGFKPVSAPAAKPPGQQKPQQPSMRCGGCDMLATGVIVKAKGIPYHVDCFKCTSCGMNLKQKGYFVVEDKLYCETHARRMAQAPGNDMVAVPVYR